jgi:hypothetical protein
MGEAKIKRLKIKARNILNTEFQTTRLSSGCDCLNCGIEIDAATSVGHKNLPQEGAIAICMICSHIMAYDEKIHLREMTDEECLTIAGDPEILFLINGLGSAKKHWEEIHGKDTWGAKARERLARLKAQQNEEKAKEE